MMKFLPLVLISFIVGCGQQTKQSPKQSANQYISQPVVYNTSAGDKIIFLEDYYKTYLQAIKTDSNRKKAYEEIVYSPIYNTYFSKSEYAQFISIRLSAPIKETGSLTNYITAVINNRTKIEELVTAALTDCRKYLKNDSLNIYILPETEDIRPLLEGMKGVLGMTAGSKQILLVINPLLNGWTEMLPYNVAHGFSDTYWTKMNFNKSVPFTLLDYMVYEGSGDSYAHLLYPDVICPWTIVLSADAENQLWERIKGQLNNTNIAFQYEVMFGLRNQYPLWGGFTLGYHIVQSALKRHRELSPAEWLNLTPDKILGMSK